MSHSAYGGGVTSKRLFSFSFDFNLNKMRNEQQNKRKTKKHFK